MNQENRNSEITNIGLKIDPLTAKHEIWVQLGFDPKKVFQALILPDPEGETLRILSIDKRGRVRFTPFSVPSDAFATYTVDARPLANNFLCTQPIGDFVPGTFNLYSLLHNTN